MMTGDLELLRDYARNKSEEAFAVLVKRHVNLTYSAALRQVRSPQLAEEVSQSVFTDLARNAHRLAPDTILTAWLYQVTRRTAIDVVRREARRQLREQIADSRLNAMNATAADWTHIEPLLDEAMHALDDTDRAAVLLRYFENKSLREVGNALGMSDDAAQKRVSRAVERLREFFSKRGVTVGASGLVVAITANAVQAAPVGLAVTISAAVALAVLGIPAAAGVGAATGFLGAILQVSRAKLVAGLAATALIGVATFMLLSSQHRPDRNAASDPRQSTAAAPAENQPAVAPADQAAGADDDQREPDPLKLLQGIAQARQRIASGSMDLLLSTDQLRNGRKRTTKAAWHSNSTGQSAALSRASANMLTSPWPTMTVPKPRKASGRPTAWTRRPRSSRAADGHSRHTRSQPPMAQRW